MIHLALMMASIIFLGYIAYIIFMLVMGVICWFLSTVICEFGRPGK